MHLNYYAVLALASSIFISGIIGIIRFKEIPNQYRPFIYLIWIGCINEVISVYFAYRYHNNIIPNIIYTLCESLFLLWFFKRLGVFQKRKNWLYFLAMLFILIWIGNSFFADRFGSQFTYYFDVAYAFCVVILSIHVVNNLLFTERELLKNPAFLICIGLIIFFTYQIIQRMFGLAGLKNGTVFQANVQEILFVVNFLTNLIFAIAVLWMRKKQAFILQFQLQERNF